MDKIPERRARRGGVSPVLCGVPSHQFSLQMMVGHTKSGKREAKECIMPRMRVYLVCPLDEEEAVIEIEHDGDETALLEACEKTADIVSGVQKKQYLFTGKVEPVPPASEDEEL